LLVANMLNCNESVRFDIMYLTNIDISVIDILLIRRAIMFRYAEVLVDVANRRLDQSYHYLIPEHLSLQIGIRVLVPLQNRKVQGLVVNVTDELPEGMEGINFKPVLTGSLVGRNDDLFDCSEPTYGLATAQWKN